MARPYRRPVGPMIPRSAAPELYKLEHVAHEAFKAAARAQGEILGYHKENFYTDILPEALLSFLNQYDDRAVALAVDVWLSNHAEHALHNLEAVPSISTADASEAFEGRRS